jgi:prolipoprotein diacylglyceryltransferase
MFIEGSAERVRVVPVQLYEALFLLALSAFLLWRFFRGKRYEMPTYMLTYGVWRFIAEYLRSDDRGQTIVDFLSPSQLVSVVLIVGGIALLVIELWIDRRKETRSAGEGAP